MSKQAEMRICPLCGCDLKFIGSLGIVGWESDWDAQADRYDCPEGHSLLVVQTFRLPEVE